MANALVVFESMYGNNRTIAHAIADGLSSRMSVEVVEVGVAPDTIGDDVRLLVVGGPTHMTGMSRPNSRKQAAEHAPQGLVSAGRGIREWFAALDENHAEAAAAAFDTRLSHPRWLRFLGSAARGVEKQLRRHGFRVISRPEHFFVEGSEGPLMEGEQERARQWGEKLVSEFVGAGQRVS